MAGVPPCLFKLRRYCVVLAELNQLPYAYGSPQFVQLYCAMCVKTVYARAKNRRLYRFSVVNTL